MPRTTFTKTLLPVAMILIAVVAGLASIRAFITPRHGGVESDTVRVGTVLSDLTLTRFGDDQKVKLSQIGSKVTMLNFWASWCEACLVEMPSIVKLRNAYAARGFEVVPMNVDEEPRSIVPKMAKLLKLDFPIYVDQGQELSQLFNVHGIPFTVILDKNRKVLVIETGERDWFSDEVKTEVEQWLKSGS